MGNRAAPRGCRAAPSSQLGEQVAGTPPSSAAPPPPPPAPSRFGCADFNRSRQDRAPLPAWSRGRESQRLQRPCPARGGAGWGVGGLSRTVPVARGPPSPDGGAGGRPLPSGRRSCGGGGSLGRLKARSGPAVRAGGGDAGVPPERGFRRPSVQRRRPRGPRGGAEAPGGGRGSQRDQLLWEDPAPGTEHRRVGVRGGGELSSATLAGAGDTTEFRVLSEYLLLLSEPDCSRSCPNTSGRFSEPSPSCEC